MSSYFGTYLPPKRVPPRSPLANRTNYRPAALAPIPTPHMNAPQIKPTLPPGTPAMGASQAAQGYNAPAAPNPAYSYQVDPAITAAFNNQLTQAQQTKTDEQKKVLMGFGSADLARRLFGNDPFVQTVGNNPFSTLNTIAHQYEGPGGLINQANEQQNQHNLFYSSNRVNNVLPELYRGRQGQEYQAQNDVQSALDALSQAYMGTTNDVAMQRALAEQQARDAAIAAALASGNGAGGVPLGPAPQSRDPLLGAQRTGLAMSPSAGLARLGGFR